jgi:hypothetical protein
MTMNTNEPILEKLYYDTKDYQHKMGRLVSRAWIDPVFADKVKNDPRAAMADVGINVPTHVTIESIPLPPRPEGISEEILSRSIAMDGSCAGSSGSLSCPSCSAGTAACAH